MSDPQAPLIQDFTALFAFNDISAMGAVRALREAKLRVPQDVSVVGFDDIRSAAYQNPALTTVRQPLQEMGRIAAETLLRRVRQSGSNHGGEITVEPKLIVRETTDQARTPNLIQSASMSLRPQPRGRSAGILASSLTAYNIVWLK